MSNPVGIKALQLNREIVAEYIKDHPEDDLALSLFHHIDDQIEQKVDWEIRETYRQESQWDPTHIREIMGHDDPAFCFDDDDDLYEVWMP